MLLFYPVQVTPNSYDIYAHPAIKIGICRFDPNTKHFEFKTDHPFFLNLDISIIDNKVDLELYSLQDSIYDYIAIYSALELHRHPQGKNKYIYVLSPKSTLLNIIINVKTYNYNTKRFNTFMKIYTEFELVSIHPIKRKYKYYTSGIYISGLLDYVCHDTFYECNTYVSNYFNDSTYFSYTNNHQDYETQHKSLYGAIQHIGIDNPDNIVNVTIVKKRTSNNKPVKTVSPNVCLKEYVHMQIANVISMVIEDENNTTNIKIIGDNYNKYNHYTLIYNKYGMSNFKAGMADLVYDNINNISPNGFVCHLNFNDADITASEIVENIIILPHLNIVITESYEEIILLKLCGVTVVWACPVSTIFEHVKTTSVMHDYLINYTKFAN